MKDVCRFLLLFVLLRTFCAAAWAADEADKAFAEKKYALARDLYDRDRNIFYEKKQDDLWKQATAQIVRCSTALDDTERAVQEYFLLCRKEQVPPLALIPLPWFVPVKPPAGVRPYEKAAEDYLNDSVNASSAGKLLAASVLSLCADNAKRLRGSEVLRQLALETDSGEPQRQVMLLARAFRWKQQLPTFRDAADLKSLQKVLEQIPESQRAGPYFLLAEVAGQVHEDELAVLYGMRVPILFPENQPLALESLRRSADALDKLGRTEQALKIRSEIKTLSNSK